MQIRVEVRMPDLARELREKLSVVLPQALNALATMTRDRLVASAQKNLRGFAQREYIRGLTEQTSIEVRESSAVVRLVGDLPSAIETGSAGYDIKKAMLAKTEKRTADGKPYVDVPIRHGVAEDAQNLQGVPTDVASSMRDSVKKAQSALRASGMSERNVKLAKVRSTVRTSARVVTKDVVGQGTLTVKHKRGIWDDMLRVPKMYGKAIQATYLTIRRISEKSDAGSWIHPGFKPAKLFDGVVTEVEKYAPRVVEDILKRVL